MRIDIPKFSKERRIIIEIKSNNFDHHLLILEKHIY